MSLDFSGFSRVLEGSGPVTLTTGARRATCKAPLGEPQDRRGRDIWRKKGWSSCASACAKDSVTGNISATATSIEEIERFAEACTDVWFRGAVGETLYVEAA